MTRRLDASEREELRPSRNGAHGVINASFELTDREKRVYLADLFWWQGPEGSWIGATHLGKRLGLSGDAVELTRRSLVAVGLQIVFDRPQGRTSGRICVLPPGMDPGESGTPEEYQAAAILLDGYLRQRRGPIPATPPPEGSGRVAAGSREGVESGPGSTRATTPGKQGSGRVAEGSRQGSASSPKNTLPATSRTQGSAEVAPGSGGGGKGGVSLPSDLRSKSQSSLRLEKVEGKREGPIGPEEERGGPGERETPRDAHRTTPVVTPENWREMLPRPRAS